MTEADSGMNPLHFEADLVDTLIRLNPEIRIRIPDHFWSRKHRSTKVQEVRCTWRWRGYALS